MTPPSCLKRVRLSLPVYKVRLQRITTSSLLAVINPLLQALESVESRSCSSCPEDYLRLKEVRLLPLGGLRVH